MLTKHLTLSFVIFVLLIQPMLLFGQKSKDKGDWAFVSGLQNGTAVQIYTKSDKEFKGTVNGVSDASISVLTKGKTETIDRADVRKVFTTGKGSIGKGVGIGAAIGAGAGVGAAAILLASTGGSDSTNQILGIGLAIGAGIGAGLGAIAGLHKRTLIYESK